ncbi:MAG: ATP-binding protein [Elusimicrobia bacterium]|nr:ATP-binding protein [Elusimicrobiota bacterium]
MSKVFPAGAPVIGSDFIDREKELKEIINLVEIGQSIAIIAPRKTGKTSLVFKAMQLLRKKYFLAYIDVFRISDMKELSKEITDKVFENRAINKFTKEVKEGLIGLLKKVELKQTVKDFEFMVKIINREDWAELFNKAMDLPELFAGKYKRKMVVIFDEFGDIDKLDGNKLLKKMRSYMQQHKNVVYIFTGSQESIMKKLFTHKASAFYNFARVLTVGRIPEDEFKKYIVEKFSSRKIRMDERMPESIVKIFEGHPFYTQLICQKLYLLCKDKKTIKNKDVKEAYENIMETEKMYCDNLWQQLKSRKNFTGILKFMSRQKDTPYKFKDLDRQQIYFILCELEKMGIVYKKAKAVYRFTDPLFRDYVKRMII